ncbi:MAG: hypothetical protein EA424_10820 [Planctomycetaceae bacterium]|nr:MAG: hypothetical protein EA424_10820 [Planctomycetaceae bacterium]
MARALRLNCPDVVYHVSSRGNGRASTVCKDHDRERFLRQLENNVATHTVCLYVWLLIVDRCVAERYGTDPKQLRQHRRRTGIAKAVAVELSCRLTGESARTVGRHYGSIRSSSLGNIRPKVREGQFDVRSDLDHLLSRVRTVHVASPENGRKV